MNNGTITWHEDKKTGQGMAVLVWDDGTRETRPLADPILAGRTDSHAVAAMFGRFASVEHDREYIHVTRDRDAQCPA